jgi:hypothetical protein
VQQPANGAREGQGVQQHAYGAGQGQPGHGLRQDVRGPQRGQGPQVGAGGSQYVDGSEGGRTQYAPDARNAEGAYSPDPRTSQASGNVVPPQGGRGEAELGGQPGAVRPEMPQWPTPPHQADGQRQ